MQKSLEAPSKLSSFVSKTPSAVTQVPWQTLSHLVGTNINKIMQTIASTFSEVSLVWTLSAEND